MTFTQSNGGVVHSNGADKLPDLDVSIDSYAPIQGEQPKLGSQ